METKISGVRTASIVSAQKCAGESNTIMNAFLLCLSALSRDEIIITDLNLRANDESSLLLSLLERFGYTVNRRLFGVSISGAASRSVTFDIWRAPSLAPFFAVLGLACEQTSTITFKTPAERVGFESVRSLLGGLSADWLCFGQYAVVKASPIVRGAVNCGDDSGLFLSSVLAGMLTEQNVVCYNHAPIETHYPDFFKYITLY